MTTDPNIRRQPGIAPGQGKTGTDYGPSFGSVASSSPIARNEETSQTKLAREDSFAKEDGDYDVPDDEMNLAPGHSQQMHDLERRVKQAVAKNQKKEREQTREKAAGSGYQRIGRLPSFKKNKSSQDPNAASTTPSTSQESRGQARMTTVLSDENAARSKRTSNLMLEKLSSPSHTRNGSSPGRRRPLKTSRSPNRSQPVHSDNDSDVEMGRLDLERDAEEGTTPRPGHKIKPFPMKGVERPPPLARARNPIQKLQEKYGPLEPPPPKGPKPFPLADAIQPDSSTLRGRKLTLTVPPPASTSRSNSTSLTEPSKAPAQMTAPRKASKSKTHQSADEKVVFVPRPFPMRASPPKRLSKEVVDDAAQARKKRRSEGFNVDDWLDADNTLGDLDDSIIEADPDKLCPYCDEPLPPSPSPTYTNLLASLAHKSYRDPRPGNPKGLKASFHVFVPLCQRHRFEEKILPQALAKGWPTHIDFAALPVRIRKPAVLGRLKAVVNEKGKSVFWREIAQTVKEKGARAVTGVHAQFENFERTQPGYYGELGSVVIHQTLFTLFRLTDFDALTLKPLTPAEFIERVLVPETALALIKEDMGSTEAAAMSTLRESVQFGVQMYPDREGKDKDGDGDGGVATRIVKERARARRKEIEAEEAEEALAEAEAEGMDVDGQTDASETRGGAKAGKKGKSKARVQTTEDSDIESIADDPKAKGKGKPKTKLKLRSKASSVISAAESDLPRPSPADGTTPKPRPKPRARLATKAKPTEATGSETESTANPKAAPRSSSRPPSSNLPSGSGSIATDPPETPRPPRPKPKFTPALGGIRASTAATTTMGNSAPAASRPTKARSVPRSEVMIVDDDEEKNLSHLDDTDVDVDPDCAPGPTAASKKKKRAVLPIQNHTISPSKPITLAPRRNRSKLQGGQSRAKDLWRRTLSDNNTDGESDAAQSRASNKEREKENCRDLDIRASSTGKAPAMSGGSTARSRSRSIDRLAQIKSDNEWLFSD